MPSPVLGGQQTEKLTKKLEGWSPRAYKDAGGYSIGWGHYIKKGEEHLLNKTLTEEEGETLFQKDLERHQAGIKKWLKKPISDLKMAALTSLAYNIGAHAKGVKTIVDLYNEGKEEEAAGVFAKYNMARTPESEVKVVNEHLAKRRELERRLFTAPEGANVDEIYAEVMNDKGPKLAGNRKGSVPGRTEVAMSGNRQVLTALEQLNGQLGLLGGNSEFMDRLRGEGSGL